MEPPPPPSPHHCTTTTSSTTTAQLSPSSLPTPQCFKCGAPTNLPPPPPPPDSSSPPAYIPIRLPAVNLPPNTAVKTQQSIILTPVPQPHPVPPLSPPFHFTTPIKRITSPSDASHFVDSISGKSFLSFVAFLSHSIRGHKISDPCPVSDTLSKIIAVFDALSSWVDEIPPALQSARYGNPAFRVWHQRMTENSARYKKFLENATS